MDADYFPQEYLSVSLTASWLYCDFCFVCYLAPATAARCIRNVVTNDVCVTFLHTMFVC